MWVTDGPTSREATASKNEEMVGLRLDKLRAKLSSNLASNFNFVGSKQSLCLKDLWLREAFLFAVYYKRARGIVKTQRNSANALELDIVATCSPPPPHPTQTIQPLLDQLESCNLAQTLIALGFDN